MKYYPSEFTIIYDTLQKKQKQKDLSEKLWRQMSVGQFNEILIRMSLNGGLYYHPILKDATKNTAFG